MDTFSSWYEKVTFRWAVRQGVARGLADFTGRLNREVVIPRDSEGRPGYELRTAGGSRVVREHAGYGRTSDFSLRTGQRGFLVGTCLGPSADADELYARATAGVEGTLIAHAAKGARCIVEPVASRLAGEPAVAYTLELTAGQVAGLIVTDWHFDHDGWSFVVGSLHYPVDGPEAQEMATAILGSWTWL